MADDAPRVSEAERRASPLEPGVAAPARPQPYAAALFASLGVSGVAFALLRPASKPWAIALAGAAAALVLGAFWLYQRRWLQGRVGERGKPAQGAIRERPLKNGGVLLELPAQGLEPWGSDAWTVLLAGAAMTAIALGLELTSWLPFGFVAALVVALGLRLKAASRDFIRIELEGERWAIDALEGGRSVHVTGHTPLLPELLSEALLLWSESGRIGTLRWELAPQERAWLAERLLVLAAAKSSVAGARDQVNQPDSDHDRQGDQRDHAD